MTTSLGGNPQGLRLMVKNNSTSAILKRGTIVYFSSIAANNPAATFLDGTQQRDYKVGTGSAGTAGNIQAFDIPFITVSVAGADSTSPGGAGRLGVVAADIPPSGFGEIITYGLARVLGGGAVTVGEVFTSDASGLAIDAANASHDNPVGLALETLASGTLGWAFINCLGVCGVGAAANTNWMGQDY